MTPEEWGRFKETFYAAMEMDAAERAAYLDSVCADDPSRRGELESFIASHQQLGSFIEPAAAEGASDAHEPTPGVSWMGRLVGHYQVLEEIGRGGMGLVYKAQDSKLGRLVALKFLPQDSVVTPEALERFQREARAASSLNHSAICTIYDVDEHQGHPYIAMELLKGQTLKERLGRASDDGSPLAADVVIDLALQIADALDAAHAEGIVHRDIKPANVFVTERGQAKLLDFGLAKMARKRRSLEMAGHGEDHYSDASEQVLTSPGVMLGTVAYMSPEQVRGEELDARADLFSLGAVVYEMATGRQAFRGSTAGVTFHLILSEAPIGASQANPKLPRELERIINKALQADKGARYQHASEIRGDLERLKRNRASGRFEEAAPDAQAAPKKQAREPVAKRMGVLFGIAALIVAAVAIILFYPSRISRRPAEPQWLRLTDLADSAVQPALSSDGRMLAFIGGPDTFIGPGQIYVKRLESGDTMQLTDDRTLKASPVFSPDNSQIAYSVPPAWDTWVVPSTGGKPRLMFANASGISFIDDKQILFSEIKLGRHMGIVIAGQKRRSSRDVYLPSSANGMAHKSYLSPDHKWVLVVEMNNAGSWLPCRLVPLDGGSSGNEVGPEHAPCTSAAWSPDGRWMYFSADAGTGFHIWRQGFPDRQVEQITSGPTDEEGIAMAPDGRSFVSSVGQGQSTVWIHDGRGDRQISSQGYAFLPNSDGVSLTHSAFSPDKRKLYYLVGRRYFSGGFISGELWMSSLDTGHNEPVVPDLPIDSYDISPDGKRVVFAVREAGDKSHLWLAPLDRSAPPRQIRSTSASDDRPVYGPGGELFFQAEEAGASFIFRMNEDGTGRQKVIREPVVQFQGVSPAGDWILAQAAAPGSEARRGVFAFSLRDESRIPICAGVCLPSWSPDGGTFLVALPGVTISAERNTTFAIPLRARKAIPPLPPEGIKSEDDIRALKGFRVTVGMAYFSPDTSVYAYTRSGVHRNLYRIPAP